MLLDRGVNVASLDLLEEQLLKASSLLGHKGVILNADACNIPFRSELFNAVIAFDLLEHIPELESSLAEINRVLVSEGLLIATVLNGFSAYSILYDRILGVFKKQ